MIVSAATTAFSLYILCSCSRRTGSTSYGGVARVAFGPGLELFTTLLLFVFLVFVITAYMVLVKNIWTPVIYVMLSADQNNDCNSLAAENSGTAATTTASLCKPKGQQNEGVVLIAIILLVSPFILRRDLHALRHNCYIGFISITILCCAIVYRAYERNAENPSLFADHVMLVTYSWADALFAYPIITLSFLCSFNIISVHGSLINPTRDRVRKLIPQEIVFAN